MNSFHPISKSSIRMSFNILLLMVLFVGINKLNAQLITYDPLFTNTTFNNKVIDQSKPVGAVDGAVDVNLSGGMNYNVPIKMIPGTNGLEPRISVQYNSQGGNGIAGWGWNIVGTSAITRSVKNNFLDGEVQPVNVDLDDVFALDGQRLYLQSGNYGEAGSKYDKEQIDFSKIEAYGAFGDGPSYFKVITKDGITYEYGNTSDSKMLDDNGDNVLFWRLNRILDKNNYIIDFKYDNTDRESKLTEIKYGGHATSGIANDNVVTFTYQERYDVNDMYEAGSRIHLGSILKSIAMSTSGANVRKYEFKYAKDAYYSYLQEIVEYGTDFSNAKSLNSTIFKYGEQTDAFEKEELIFNNLPTVSAGINVSAGDYNGDGLSDVVLNHHMLQNNISMLFDLELYKKLSNGTYHYQTHIVPPNNTLNKKDQWGRITSSYVKNPFTVSSINSDFNGDGKEDRFFISTTTASTTSGLGDLQELNLVTLNSDPTSPNFIKFPLSIPPDNFDNTDPSGNSFITGDFDGDHRNDVIIFGRKFTANFPSPIIVDVRAYLYSASNNYAPKLISGIHLDGSTGINASETNILDVDNQFHVIDFDGDGKSEIVKRTPNNTQLFTISKNAAGDYVATNRVLTDQLLDFKLFPGDFNGDGKNDLLVITGSSLPISTLPKILLSTGKEFIENSISFSRNISLNNFPAGTISGLGEHTEDNLIVADFNGDGKTDIIHGKRGTGVTTQACPSGPLPTDYSVELFISKGIGFTTSIINFVDDVMCGVDPILSAGSINESNNPFIVCDMNGDGRADLLYKNNNSTNAFTCLSFNKNGQEKVLQKIKNGFNNTTEIAYGYLTEGLPLYDRANIIAVTTTNFNTSHPKVHTQPPLLVVKSVSTPNGIGGLNTTEYKYKYAYMNPTGRGFLGFSEIHKENTLLNTKIISTFITQHTYFVPQLKKVETFALNTGTALSEITYNNSFTNYGGKLFQVRNDETVNTNHIQGYIEINTNVSFDYWNNVTSAKSTKTVGASTKHETNITTTYTNASDYSAAKYLPTSITITNTRTGSPALTTQTNYDYNSKGNVIKEIQYANLAQKITTDYTYYTHGRLNEKITSATSIPYTRITKYFYDLKKRYNTYTAQYCSPANPNLSFGEASTYDYRWGIPIYQESSNCIGTSFTADEFGRIISTKYKVATSEEYSVQNNRNWNIAGSSLFSLNITHPGRPDETTLFDKLGRPISAQKIGFNNQPIKVLTTYDAKGNLSTETNSYLSTEVPDVTTTTYDDFNRVTNVANSQTSTAYAYNYSGGNREVVSTTISGQIKKTLSDATGKVIESEDGGGKLSFSYDSWGNQLSVKKAATTFISSEYDAYNRLRKYTDINAGETNYLYDAFGQQTQQIDPKGNIHVNNYDEIGMVISKQIPEGTGNITYTFVGASTTPAPNCQQGYLAQVVDFNGTIKNFEYDNFGRITKERTNILGKIFDHRYTYDRYDNLVTHTYPSGFKVYNEYTNDGYLNKTGYPTAFSGGTPAAFKYFYTASEFNGYQQPTKYILGNGYNTRKEYVFGKLTSEKVNNATTTIQHLLYEYNLATQNMTSRSNNLINAKETFTYDKLDRLTSTVLTNTLTGISEPSISYKYDGSLNNSLGNIKSIDMVGNYNYSHPQKHGISSADGFFPAGITTTPYAAIMPDPAIIPDIDQDIEYTSFQMVDNISEGIWNQVFNYDDNFNRMKSVLSNNTGDIHTKYYIGDYEELNIAPTNEEYKLNYILGGDGLCAIVLLDDTHPITNPIIHYVYKDHLGSLVLCTNSTGTIEAQQSFDVWGRPCNPNDWKSYVTTASPKWLYRGYTGHEMMPEFRLINMNGRMYDPAVGRMLSPDKYIADGLSTQSYNRYTYCNNNPLRYTDPSGQIALGDDAIVAVVGFAIGYVSYGIRHDDWGWKAVGSGGIGAGVALLSYYTAGGFALAAGGTVSGGASFAANYAISAAVNSFLPSVNIPISNNFSISMSVGLGVGAAGLGAGFNVSGNYSEDGFSASLGYGAGVGGTGAYSGYGGSAGYGDFKAGYNRTSYSGAHSQVVGGVSLTYKNVSFRLENDVFGDGHDRWRSNAFELSIGNFVIGSNLYNNEVDKSAGVDLDGRMLLNNSTNRNGNGAWKDGQTHSSPLWVGFKTNGQIYRFGYSDRHVQDATQNVMHKWGGPFATHFFNRYDDFKRRTYHYSGYNNPYSLW